MRTPIFALAAILLAAAACKKKEPPAPPPRPAPTPVTTPPAAPPTPAPAALDTAAIDRLTGLKGEFDAKSGVYKVSVPRKDLAVSVGHIKVTPALGLTAWAAFQPAGDKAMVMGDIVVTEDQIDPVMLAALDAGLEVTALHNHFSWDSPHVMFMHIGGMGDVATLATGVGKVFEALKATEGGKGVKPPAEAIDPAKSKLDPGKLDAIFGQKGSYASGVYKAVFGRTIKMGDVEVGGAMGVNTWAAIAGTEDHAVVDGDFAALESELQGVLKALRHSGISVVAIHQHMTGEQPRIIFLHYFGTGRAEDLARAVKGALDTQHP